MPQLCKVPGSDVGTYTWHLLAAMTNVTFPALPPAAPPPPGPAADAQIFSVLAGDPATTTSLPAPTAKHRPAKTTSGTGAGSSSSGPPSNSGGFGSGASSTW